MSKKLDIKNLKLLNMKTITFRLMLTILTMLGLSFNVNAQMGGNTDIVTYSFAEQTGDATITPATTGNATIDIEVKYGTDLNGLIATFTLEEDGASAYIDATSTDQVSDETPNNFVEGEALVYTITDEGGSTADWDIIVTIAAASSENDILDFNLPNQNGDETINATLHTVEVTVSSSTDVTNLIADFILSEEATANIDGTDQVSNETANNFTDPVTYTIVAQDGTEQEWEVTVKLEDNKEANIISYSFAEQTGDATIINPVAGQNGTVDIEVEYGTDITNLVATFELSYGASSDISGTIQESATTANDFTNTVTYTVTAEDETITQDWDITVTIAAAKTGNDILNFNLTDQIGDETINTVQHTVDVTVGQGADITSLVATFELSEEATANISGVNQESGITINDYTLDVIYTVVAQNGDEQDWTITVTVSTEDNTEANITAYSFIEQTGDATITNPIAGQNGTVDIEVEYGTDVTDLVATFELSYGASSDISGTIQESATTANDFTNTVTYTVTAEDGTTIQDWDITVTIATSTGINYVAKQNKFNFYPNPATNNIKLNSLNKNIQIIDITGKLVKQILVTSHNQNINISDLQKGIYFVKSGNDVKKLIKK